MGSSHERSCSRSESAPGRSRDESDRAGSTLFTAGCTPWATGGLTARAVDGRDPGDRRCTQPSVGGRPLGPPPVERPDRDHDPWNKSQRPGLLLHRAVLAPDEVTTHDGIPVTTPARTQLDLAGVLQKHQLQQAINEAERLRLDGPQPNRHPTKRGTANLRTLAPPTHTRRDLEARFTTFLNDRRFPAPQTNVLIEGMEVDFAWPERGVVVELDSWEYHGTRAAFERDRRRDRILVAAGWRPCGLPGATWMSPDPSRESSGRWGSSSAARRSSPGPCRRRRTWSRGRSCASSVSRSLSSVVMMRAPVIPNGWPRAIAPPNGLSFSWSMPHSSRQGTTWAANASLSSSDVDVVDRHAGLLQHASRPRGSGRGP